jgi:hypothetical protein
VQHRHQQTRVRTVDGGVERLQRRLERECRVDDADDVVQAGRDGARGGEGQEGEGQCEQQAQQRGGAHLAGDRPDGHAQRAAAERARGPRDQPLAEAGPVHPGQRPDAAQHRHRDDARADGGQQDLLGQQAGLGDQAAHQPAVGLLLALQRQHAAGQQHRDEQQRDGDGEHDGEVVQRGALPVDDGRLDRDRLADRVERRRGEAQPDERLVGEVADLLQPGAGG